VAYLGVVSVVLVAEAAGVVAVGAGACFSRLVVVTLCLVSSACTSPAFCRVLIAKL